jgi:hypothetical protein
VLRYAHHISKSIQFSCFPNTSRVKSKLNMGRLCFFFFFLSILSLPIIFPAVAALPLHTSSRWIVDEAGQRVKLACVNWVTHLEAVVVEGLSKQPVDTISKRILSMGFNCVRLTWPLYLVTNDSLASLTVRQSFQSLGLSESIAGFQANNPSIIDLSLIQAYQVTRAEIPVLLISQISLFISP